MKARVVGVVAVTAVSPIAVGAMLAPVAQSGSSPGLKLTTRNSGLVQLRPNTRRTVSARCPKGSHATGMGQLTGGIDVLQVQKQSARKVTMTVQNRGTTDVDVAIQALCAEGTGGFRMADDSTAFRF